MTCGIYKITNITNGKMYVGLSVNVEKRFIEHRTKLNRNCHDNCHLQNAWNKYGSDSFSFSIIEKCDKSNLGDREKYWISELQTTACDDGYNLTSGGEHPNLTQEVKDKISKTLKSKPHYLRGIPLTEERRKYLSDISKGRKHTEEFKRHQSILNTGERNHAATITESKALQIIDMLLTTTKNSIEIATELSVKKNVVNGIRCKRSWKYLTKDIEFPVINWNKINADKRNPKSPSVTTDGFIMPESGEGGEIIETTV